MISYLKNNPAIAIFLVCLTIFFANLDVLYINIMEARNFVAAREMVTDGNWILTTLNGLPRYEKPPLPTWLTAISGSIFGMKNLFGLRLPAALVATFMVWMFYKLGLKIHANKKLGLIGSLILASSFYIIFAGRNGQWDIFTHSFMVASIYFLFRFFQSEERLWKNALLASLFFGFSFLSKGPVSLYALWLPFIIAYALVFKFKGFKTKIFPFISFLILGLGVGISWFAYVRFADPTAFLEITKEETANWGSYNIRPFHYYWSFFTQSGIWTVPAFIGLLYPYLKNRVSNKKAYQFSLLWTLASVVLLSAIPEKKARYLLPVLIPLAMNTAFYVEYLINHFKTIKNKKETYPVYFNFGLIALIGVVFPIAGYIFFGEKLSGLWFSFILTSITLFAIGLLMFIHLKKKNIEQVFYLTIAFIMSVMLFGFPVSKAFNKNKAFNNIDHLALEAKSQNLKVYSFGEIAPEMLWLFGENSPRLDAKKDIRTPTDEKFGVLVTLEKEEEFRRIFAGTYKLDFRETFDVNYTASPGEKAHKDRLLNNYYIVKKNDGHSH